MAVGWPGRALNGGDNRGDELDEEDEVLLHGHFDSRGSQLTHELLHHVGMLARVDRSRAYGRVVGVRVHGDGLAGVLLTHVLEDLRGPGHCRHDDRREGKHPRGGCRIPSLKCDASMQRQVPAARDALSSSLDH